MREDRRGSERPGKRTAREEAVLGEDCYGIDEEYRDCAC
jgi:hypothetical protein